MIKQLELSLDYYRFQARLGAAAFWNGVDFSRSIEYPLVASRLKPQPGDQVLEIGGGSSTFGLYLAWRNHNSGFVITDFEEGSLALLEDTAPKLNLQNYQVRLEDATRLTFPDNSFDRVIAVSSLEHIPQEGDRMAVSEIGRVLKEDGIAVITVPYSPVYHLDEQGRFGYMRHYNVVALKERLAEPSGLMLDELIYFNDQFSVSERLVYRELPVGARVRNRFFRHLSAVMGPMVLKLHDTPPSRDSGALLVLRKRS